MSKMDVPFPSPVKGWHNSSYAAIDPSLPSLSAKGKVIVVTGGGSGIGLAIAKAFSKAGTSKIAILGRTERTLISAQKEIQSLYPGSEISYFVADVASESSVNAAFERIRAKLGLINILVSNAGFLPDIKPIKDSSVNEWWHGYEVNVKGTLIVAKAALKASTEDAVLINITSAIAHVPYFPGYSSYATSKMAAAKLYEYLQQEYPTRYFLSVHPGVIETEMDKKGRASGPSFPHDDIELPAYFVVWAASPEARFLKGKLVWSHWDVEELRALSAKIESSGFLTTTLDGWPFAG